MKWAGVALGVLMIFGGALLASTSLPDMPGGNLSLYALGLTIEWLGIPVMYFSAKI